MEGIRRYVADHQLQVVETDDFRKAMEAAYGKDLKWFFDQWVYKAGHPELKVRWHYEDADKTVRVRIEQTQKVDDQTPLFRLPTILAITEDVGRTRKVPIVIDGASHEFVIPAASRPKMVQIDPEAWLIKEVDFEKTEAENLFQLENAACVLGRLEAARGLLDAAKTKSAIAKALSAPWKREKAVAAHGSWSICSATDRSPSGPHCSRRPSDSEAQGPRRGHRRPGQAGARRHDRVDPRAPPGRIRRKPTGLAGPRCGV